VVGKSLASWLAGKIMIMPIGGRRGGNTTNGVERGIGWRGSCDSRRPTVDHSDISVMAFARRPSPVPFDPGW